MSVFVLCRVCGREATGGVNVMMAGASSVETVMEPRCSEHMTTHHDDRAAPGFSVTKAERDLRVLHYKFHDSDVRDVDQGPIVEWDECPECSEDWPCDVGQLLATLDATRQALAAAEADRDRAWHCVEINSTVARELGAQLAAAEARERALRVGLEWYADSDHYNDDHAPGHPGYISEWTFDNGARARAALGHQAPEDGAAGSACE